MNSTELDVLLAGQSVASGFIDTSPFGTPPAVAAESNADGALPGVSKWLGIPYGSPARWEVITEWPEWQGKRLCHRFGNRPMSSYHPFEKLWDDAFKGLRETVEESEDECLVINVFKPTSVKNTDQVPVLAYHHGGGLHVGQSGCINHDPTELVRLSEARGTPTIVVTFNYRVNIFGFLSHPDLGNETSGGICGNYGLHDQISALSWVQTFISRFGGDPANVTCLGSSAGAFSLVAILCRNLTNSPKRLFRRLCLHSGTVGSTGFSNMHYPYYDNLLRDFGIDKCSSADSRRSLLAAIPAQELRVWADTHIPQGNWSAVQETGTKAVFDTMPILALQAGKFDPSVESVIIGNTGDEGTVLGPVMKMASKESFRGHLERFGPDLQDVLDRLYPVPKDYQWDVEHPTESPACRLMGDHFFIAPIDFTVSTLVNAVNNGSGKQVQVNRYMFNCGLPKVAGALGLGAFHTVELGYLFNLSLLWEAGSKEEQVAKNISGRWLDFVHSGNPGWPSESKDSPGRGAYVFSTDQDEGGYVTGQVSEEWQSFWHNVMHHQLL